MRAAIAIARREIFSFFVTPVAYFALAGFVLLAGYFFFTWLGSFNSVLNQYLSLPMGAGKNVIRTSNLNLNTYVIEPYHHVLIVLFVFLVPLITLRTFAEERRSGTFELLATSPLSSRSLVVGKFFGVCGILLILLAVASLFPVFLFILGDPAPEIGPFLSGLFGVALVGCAFIGVSMAVTSLTKSPILAGLSSMITLLLLYVIHSPAESVGGTLATILSYLSPVMQVDGLIRGVISLEACVYLLSLLAFGVFLSLRALESERLR